MILHTKEGETQVDPVTIDALKLTWPTKAIDTELAKMHLWLVAHPSKRPSRLWVFVKRWLKKSPDVTAPPLPVGAGWWKSEQATLATAASLGLAPRPGEEMPEFRRRISGALAAARH